MSRQTRLPLLGRAEKALETCGYCPKLCRSTCPVSNVEAREALIPWAKMSSAWLVARGDLDADRATAATAWGCTGCHACSGFCEHKNPVANTLFAARAGYRELGLAPESVAASEARHGSRMAEASQRLAQLAREPGVRANAQTALLVGCAYLRKAPAEARAIVRSAVALSGEVRLLSGCCGAPLLHAGDEAGFEAARAQVREGARGTARLVVGDPGCALVLAEPSAIPLVGLAAENPEKLRRIAGFGANAAVRFHDPCALGRGLSQYEAPRVVLERALGRAADEFERRREGALCSGGGALLPVAMPETSRGIAEQRLAEHGELGGGTLVTACAASLRRFRAEGERALDIATVIAQSLGLSDE